VGIWLSLSFSQLPLFFSLLKLFPSLSLSNWFAFVHLSGFRTSHFCFSGSEETTNKRPRRENKEKSYSFFGGFCLQILLYQAFVDCDFIYCSSVYCLFFFLFVYSGLIFHPVRSITVSLIVTSCVKKF